MKTKKINYLTLAFRNLGRHKLKTILTMLAIIVGIAFFIFLDGWLLGMEIETKRNLVNHEIGAAKIYSQSYFDLKDEMPLYEGFYNYQPIIEHLDQQGYHAAPRVVFNGILFSHEQELAFMLIGVDPKQEKALFSYSDYVERGTFLQDGQFNIMLGVKGATDLGVDVGDTVRIATTIDKKDKNEKIHHIHQVIDLKVSGIINSPNPKINGNIGYIPLNILQDESGLLLEGMITEICIRKKNVPEYALFSEEESPAYLRNILGQTLPDHLTVVSWEEDAKDFLTLATSKRGGTSIVLILLFIIAALGVSNTILMASLERTKELGMMRALGMTNGEIVRTFLYEAGLIGLIGSLIGIGLGCLVNIYMVNVGIDFSEILQEVDMGYRVVGVLKGAWSIQGMIGAGIGGILIPILTALPTALKVSRGSIVDALRFS